MIIDGRRIAEKILKRLKKQPRPRKILAAVLVGRNPTSLSFLKQKEKTAKFLGVKFRLYKLSSKISAAALKRKIFELNRDPRIGGIILQLPLPRGINRDTVIASLEKKKDVDALRNSALVLPTAVGALKAVLQKVNFRLENKKAIVVGRGFLVGKPSASWLKNKVQKLTITDKGILDKKSLRAADLVITGVGEPNLIKARFIKKGAVLIDFGYTFREGKISGDLDFKSCLPKASYLTSTPGGTGPIVVAKLFENFFRLTRRR